MTISREQRIAMAAGGGLLALLLIFVVVRAAVSGGGKPSLSSDPVEVARYMAKPEFAKMRQEEQLSYMSLLSKSTPDLNAAFRARKITEAEYTAGLIGGYLARKSKQVEGYMRLNSIKDRNAYLDKIIDKDAAQEKAAPAAEKKDDEPLIKLDFSEMAKEHMKSWPADRRDDFEDFRKALKERRKARGIPS
jgi:hypothetical protein